MICLGIESTAHTFGVGITDDKGKILANVKDSYMTKKGGIIPSEAAEHHVNCCDVVLKQALTTSQLTMEDIDIIAFSQSPGIGHCLRIGAMFARALAMQYRKILIGVNHCIAHLEIGRLITYTNDPILLYVSGANTQVIAYEAKRYRVMGETLDIGIGNLLDSFARELGLGFPGGPKIYELALKGKNYIELPYVVKGMDVSFGGLFTQLKQKIASKKYKTEDLCYSVQETVYAMMVEVAERALAHCDKTELLLGGGVACNLCLQEMCRIMCSERGAKLFIPTNEFLIDNAAMIAWTGLLQYKSGQSLKIEEAKILPNLRTDDIEVTWRD